MKIKDIMSKNPKHLNSNLSMYEAAKEMSIYGFDAYPVMENDRVVGMITMQDIVMRAVATNKDMKSTRVKEMMTTQVFSCNENSSLEEVATMMAEHDINGVPVMNDSNGLVGFVSLDDFIHKGKNETMWHKMTCALHRTTT